MTFEEVARIEDLTKYPWTRKKEVQEAYDRIENKTQAVLSSMIAPKELRPNEYPYDLSDDCLHLVLWSKRDLTQDQVDKYLKRKLKNREYVAFTNMTQNQPVNIFHAHVICKI